MQREAELKVKEMQTLKAMEVETDRWKKATAAPAKSRPAKAAGPVIKREPEPASPGSKPSVLWSGRTPDLPEPDTAALHFSMFQCLTVTSRHVNHCNSPDLGDPPKVVFLQCFSA